ncbi:MULTISPECIES: hypothetical protein [Pseudomonas syringae group]|uniref:hypothetical protein n=1 Tax=Pseudomonas syringae group TaxID=136849 RepID=UPI001C80B297|nr:hypothetical protein [Pseudomonas syringae group genomosp. 7]
MLAVADRRWRVRGWKKNLGPEQMRVNVQVRREVAEEHVMGREAAYYVDSFDLYAARARYSYLKQASIELGVPEEIMKRDLGKLLLKLEGLQEASIQAALAPKSPTPTLSAEDELAALNLLRAPNLIERIEADLTRCGVVGESYNLLAGYLAAVSRKLDQPLAVLIQSSSAAGKSSLMDAVLNLMPEEERIQYSAMTGQSLFYLGETDLQHKILAIAEEEGVRPSGLRAETAAIGRRVDHCQHRQGRSHRQLDHQAIHGQRPRDADAHHHRDRRGRRVAQPLFGADHQRKPRTNRSHSRSPTQKTNPRRPAGRR